MEYILYHGSVESFDKFDESKIRENETDAVFNGFWFTSDNNPSPAWVNPNYRKTCKVTINNAAPFPVINELYKKLYDEGIDWSCTRVRKELLKMEYDGVIFCDIPSINKEQLEKDGYFEYITVRGSKYKLVINEENHGIDLYSINKFGREECITGYLDLEDFLSQQELIIVAFTSKQIDTLEEIPIK